MFNRSARLLPLLLLLGAGGCELVGDIFQFGFWAGVVVFVVLLGVVGLVVRGFRR